MAQERIHIDISNEPELRHLVSQVEDAGVPAVLEVDGQGVAVLTPANRSVTARTGHSRIGVQQTGGGQETYIVDTALSVWEVAWIAREYAGDADRTAQHLGVDRLTVQAALAYAHEHESEIEKQIQEHVGVADAEVRRRMPRAKVPPKWLAG